MKFLIVLYVEEMTLRSGILHNLDYFREEYTEVSSMIKGLKLSFDGKTKSFLELEVAIKFIQDNNLKNYKLKMFCEDHKWRTFKTEDGKNIQQLVNSKKFSDHCFGCFDLTLKKCAVCPRRHSCLNSKTGYITNLKSLAKSRRKS